MKIGLKITNFIYRGDYPAYKDKLVEIGLGTMKMRIDTRHWEFIYQGMKMYKSIYGHLRVRYHHMWTIIFTCCLHYSLWATYLSMHDPTILNVQKFVHPLLSICVANCWSEIIFLLLTYFSLTTVIPLFKWSQSIRQIKWPLSLEYLIIG